MARLDDVLLRGFCSGVVALAPALALVGCDLSSCDRAGCAAIEHPRDADIEGGVAGVAASPSDVVENGCQPCPLTRGMLSLYVADDPVETPAEAEAVFMGGMPTREIAVDGAYETELPAGPHLACIDQGDVAYCTGIEVPEQGVVTVHLVYPYGPPRLVVFEPDADQPREDMTHEIMPGG